MEQQGPGRPSGALPAFMAPERAGRIPAVLAGSGRGKGFTNRREYGKISK